MMPSRTLRLAFLRWSLATAVLPVCALAAGCAKPPPPKTVVEDKPVVEERVDTGPSHYESEIGGMNQDAVESTFKSMSKSITGCFESSSQRLEQLGGSFTISFRVDRQGNTRWAYMKASTLGDRETESCLLTLVREKTWPKPVSGEGLAEKTIEIEPAKAPHVLDKKRLKPVMKFILKATAKCRLGVRGSFSVTAYLAPNGKTRMVGVATPDEKADAAADCISTEIQKLRFMGTGKVAKVTFEI